MLGSRGTESNQAVIYLTTDFGSLTSQHGSISQALETLVACTVMLAVLANTVTQGRAEIWILRMN